MAIDLRTSGKLGLGCAAIAPLVSAVVLGAYVAYELIAHDLRTRGLGSPPDPLGALVDGPFEAGHFVAFGAVVVAIVVLELVLTVVLTLHAARDPRLQSWAVVLWALGFLFAGPLALPLYVALYVLREPTPKRVAELERAPIAE